MKAFLSHSSKDKEFVAAVARELGRPYSFYDAQSFANGEEFKSAIERGLDESDLFVLFGSQVALKSLWVEFEVEEAWYRRLGSKLSKSMVYMIESSVSLQDIPSWLKRALIRPANAPKAVARDIRYQLDELLRSRQRQFFFGRSAEAEQVEAVLTPFDGSVPPHAVFVTGLPGIGRRQLVKNTVPTILNIPKQIEMKIGQGDSINDICLTVATHIEPYSTDEGFKHIVNQIRNLSEKEAVRRLLNSLREIVASGELPLFLDDGGLLDSDGFLSPPVASILRNMEPNDDAYIFFISPRRPQRDNELDIPVIPVEGLEENAIKRLLTALLQQSDVPVSPNALSELAAYVAGYPPSAYYAAQQVKTYGIDAIMADKARLVTYRKGRFMSHLSNLHLTAEEEGVLKLLANYSPMPLAVIAKVLDTTMDALQSPVIRLIDHSLMSITDDGYYRIALPLSEAAASTYGFPAREQHQNLANELYNFLQEQEVNRGRLELSRALFRAARLAHDPELASKAVHFANDLLVLVEKLYHAQKYDEAINTAFAAIEERPNNAHARYFLVRALVQEERFSEAQDELVVYQKIAPPKDYHFLLGFYWHQQGRIAEAINEYKEAERLGRGGASINRELAHCYVLTHNLPEAEKYVRLALGRDADNPYIVDLWAQIATDQGKRAEAQEALNKLEILGKPIHYFFRRSRVAMSFGDEEEALRAAQNAVESESTPPFKALAQFAYCQIAVRQIDNAEKTLKEMDQRFGKVRHDVRTGLRCRLELAQAHYSHVVVLSDRIRDKNTYIYRQIRKEALAGELRVSALKDATRVAYENEISRLKSESNDLSIDQVFPTDIT